MYRTVFTPWRVLRRATIGLAVLTVAGLIPAHAQQPSSACGLLQVAEIESAIGGKARTKLSGSSQDVQNMSLDECSVEISVPGHDGIHRVGINIVTKLPMDGADAIRIRNTGTAREQQWKVPGARLEQKTVALRSVSCLAGPMQAAIQSAAFPGGRDTSRWT